MSDIMRPMAFEQLLEWILTEKKQNGTVFGTHHPYFADEKNNRTIFGRPLETPVGPPGPIHSWRRTLRRHIIQEADSSN